MAISFDNIGAYSNFINILSNKFNLSSGTLDIHLATELTAIGFDLNMFEPEFI